MARGILTEGIKGPDHLAEDDLRRHFPWFQGENLAKNLALVEKVRELTLARGCTVPQLAVNWVRHLSKKDGNPVIIPIPGATTVDRILENSKVIDLSSEEVAAIDSILKGFEVAGHRYPAALQASLEG